MKLTKLQVAIFRSSNMLKQRPAVTDKGLTSCSACCPLLLLISPCVRFLWHLLLRLFLQGKGLGVGALAAIVQWRPFLAR